MTSIEYRDVQYRVPRCRIFSVPRCPDTSRTTKYTRFRLIFFKLIDKYPLGWYILFILAGLGCFVNSTICDVVSQYPWKLELLHVFYYSWIFTQSLIIFKIYVIHKVINYFPNQQIHENFLTTVTICA